MTFIRLKTILGVGFELTCTPAHGLTMIMDLMDKEHDFTRVGFQNREINPTINSLDS